MKKHTTIRHRMRGGVAIELTLFTLFISMLSIGLVEGGRVLNTYSQLLEATREGARMALRQGDTAGIDEFVSQLTADMDGTTPSVNVKVKSLGPDTKTVTVQVEYDYYPFFIEPADMDAASLQKELFGGLSDPIRLTPKTTMPMQ
ncbi:TadE/TadG family type IV pilus assembly protein [Desulfovibrio inopinatus]|uniref:TadE/TadG family type IV pilus assembly protein n=1 Tax=Desulfovibrio inopinatus TaxID=102109 RepID=UPI0003FDAAE5|nr:TadE/TadG family type IV pilus assembly protein [Desulfovibrio inopinatus]